MSATATAVPVTGFAVPPAAPGTQQHSRNAPAGAVPPAAPQAPAAPAGVPPVPTFPTNQAHPPVSPETSPAAPAAQAPAGNTTESTLDPTVAAYITQAIAEAKAAPAGAVPAEAPEVTPISIKAEDVGSIENPQIRSLGQLLLNVVPDLDIDRVFSKALEYGDPTLVDVAYLKEKGGANGEQLQKIARQIIELSAAESQANEAAVYATAGDEAQWRAAVAVFNQHAPKHLKTVAAKLLDAPNKSQILEGAKFVVEFARQGGFMSTPAELLTAAGGRTSENGIGKAEFQKRLGELRDRRAAEPAFDSKFEENELFRLRQIGKSRGL